MKRSILCLFFVTLLQIAPAQTFKVTVTFANAKEGTMLELLAMTHDKNMQPLATGTVRKSKCVFKGTLPAAEPICVRLRLKNDWGFSTFMLQPNDQLQMTCTLTLREHVKEAAREYDSYDMSLKIANSPLNDKYEELNAERLTNRNLFSEMRRKHMDRFRDYNEAIRKAGSREEMARLRETFDGKLFDYGENLLVTDMRKRDSTLLAKYADTFWAPILMTDLYWYFTPRERPLYEMWTDTAKNTWHGKQVRAELYPGGKPGEKAPSFCIKDQQGKSHSSASLYKGKKVVLLDFWASWCGPCRREIPNVKKQYERYKDKGFEVISISIDKDEQAWKKALEEENLPWPNFLDREGISDIYKIKSIPAMFLMKSDGTIIAEGMDARGEALAKQLSSLLE